VTWSERIARWPSTHVNLISSWVAMVVSIALSWVIVLRNLTVNDSVYYFLMAAVFAWAGVTAPAVLIGKRATEKPELRQTTTTEAGPPARTVTTTESVPRGTPKEGE
jgi:hypothetical protein